MDIQGSECIAFKGMANLLHNNRGIKILMEYSPPLLQASGAEPEELLKLLTDHDFKLYELNEAINEDRTC